MVIECKRKVVQINMELTPDEFDALQIICKKYAEGDCYKSSDVTHVWNTIMGFKPKDIW
jgi:hypothetical protein